MEESDENDEATVMPASRSIAKNPNIAIIVSAQFISAKEGKYSGFLYWRPESEIDSIQPGSAIGVPLGSKPFK